MKVTKNDIVVLFDVDDTLVTFTKLENSEPLYLKYKKKQRALYPIKAHIDCIIKHKFWGHHVVVHSKGGYKWALKVIKLLGLEDYVDEVKSKPLCYYDDLTADEWMDRRYECKTI